MSLPSTPRTVFRAPSVRRRNLRILGSEGEILGRPKNIFQAAHFFGRYSVLFFSSGTVTGGYFFSSAFFRSLRDALNRRHAAAIRVTPQPALHFATVHFRCRIRYHSVQHRSGEQVASIGSCVCPLVANLLERVATTQRVCFICPSTNDQ